MTDTTDTTIFRPADDYKEQMAQRHEDSRKLVKKLSTDNPLAGLTPEQMHEVNARCRALQDGLRGAMCVGISRGADPVVCFSAALESLLSVFSTMEQTDQTREAVGYLLTIAQGISQSPEGPFSILHGEMYLSAVVDTTKEVSKTVRKHLGLPETGDIEPGTHMMTHVAGEDNTVIDAAHLFRAKGGAETVH